MIQVQLKDGTTLDFNGAGAVYLQGLVLHMVDSDEGKLISAWYGGVPIENVAYWRVLNDDISEPAPWKISMTHDSGEMDANMKVGT